MTADQQTKKLSTDMENVDCILCGDTHSHLLFHGKDLLYHTTPKTFAIVACNTCGLAFVNPRPTSKAIARYYPDQYGTFHTSPRRVMKRGLMSYVRTCIQKFSRKPNSNKRATLPQDQSRRTFLDFGCGNGTFLLRTKKTHPHWDLYGIDIDQRACRAASREGLLITCGNILNKPYPENFFDEINSSQVLEHVQNPLEVLKELRRILKPGGVLAIDVPNFNSIPARFFRSSWYNLDVPRHLYQFTPSTLEALLKKSGFDISQIKTRTSSKILLASIDFLFKKKLSTEINSFMINILRPAAWLLNKINQADYLYVIAKKPIS